MGKTNKCIDCNKLLRNMSPLAKRCKKCRRAFQDKSSYEKKKRDRAEISKKKALEKVRKKGADKEIIEESYRKVIKDLEKPLSSQYQLMIPKRSFFGDRSMGELVDERIENKFKEREAKINNDILNEKIKKELEQLSD